MTEFKLDLQISRPQAKRLAKLPFFALYLGKFGSIPMPVFLLSKILSALCPRLAEFKPPRLKDQKELSGLPMAPYSTIQKTENSFIVEFPLFEKVVVDDLLNSLYNFSSAVQNIIISNGQATLSVYEDFKSALAKYLKDGQASFLFKKEQITQFMKTEPAKLSFSCFDYLFLSFQDNIVSAKAQIRISKEEAELLTQLPFVAIREIDIYPITLHWIYSNYQKGPTTAVSLSRVASSLSASLEPKVNEESLALTDEGNIIYLPKKLDKASDYEAAYIRYCTNNKKFGLKVNSDQGSLPSNMPVLVDWKNLKFSYSNGFGYLSILDLSQYRKLTPTHIRNVFIRTEFSQNYLNKLLKYADELGMEEKDLQVEGNHIANYFWSLLDSTHIINLSVYDMMGDDYFKPIIDFCTKLYQLLVSKAEFFMARYSVITYYETLGLLKAISVYGNKWDDIETADFANREAAVYQGLDKDYSLPGLPFWQNAPGLMPHQVRVANLLKKDPTFALLPVAAGGGKTIISIMDVLKHYSQQKNGPYIILCPNLLVGQYVNEIAFFTKGRLNAIPLTTSVIIREGLSRLKKIIDGSPRNTVVVASYNAVVYNSHEVAYGTNTISRFPVVEFLRSFHFGYAICDESHQLKNVKADRSNAVRTLLADIPFIRLSSGTLAYNRINDLVGQTAIMDPSIFGSKDDFDKQYGDFTERGRLIGLKQDAEISIDRKIKSQMVIARAQRKEWAALLPKTKTRYHLVDLTPLESNVYNQILELTAESIATNSDIQKSMKKLEQMREELKKNYDPELEDEIEEKETKLGSRLTPYLQRLERFVVDPLRESALITEFSHDYISAKAQKVIDIVETHIKGGFDWQVDTDGIARKMAVPPVQGKVIIFTENIASAESIYDAFIKHSSVAANGLLYKAANKHELLERFNTDPNIRWMVGVETSINTGLNLQTASRIIRVEYPWQPGALEQGNARILRPLLKTKENREIVYFDWVLCEATIDTLKVSRLMAKAVEIARFEHPGDSRYQKIGVDGNPITGQVELKVPMISITLNTIKACMRFTEGQDHGELYDYYDAMRSLHNLEAEDYESYRKNHPEELTEDGKLKTYPLITLPNPQDAKLLTYTPRVENTVLYGIDTTRLDEYINQKADTPEKLDEVAKSLKGKQVFSEYGKSTIYSVRTFYPLASVIPFTKKYRVELPWSSLFLTEEDLNQKLETITGLQSVSIEDVEPAGALTVGRRVKKEEQSFVINSAQLTIKLSVLLVNGRLGLRFADKKNAIASSILSQSGFKLVPSYYRAIVKDYQTLHGWLVKMMTSGYKFRAPYDYTKPWRRIRNVMQKKKDYKAGLVFTRKLVDKYQLTAPIDWDGKALNRHDLLRVQPLISNGVVFATMPDNKIYPTGKEIRRKRGLKWEIGPTGYERYFSTIKELVSCIKGLKQQGFTISNIEQIKSALKKYRIM